MSVSRILKIIKNNGGTIHMSEALDAGINRYTLYSMLEKGEIERLSRGVYRASNTPAMMEPDLAMDFQYRFIILKKLLWIVLSFVTKSE